MSVKSDFAIARYELLKKDRDTFMYNHRDDETDDERIEFDWDFHRQLDILGFTEDKYHKVINFHYMFN
jgi:hypothetical protein